MILAVSLGTSLAIVPLPASASPVHTLGRPKPRKIAHDKKIPNRHGRPDVRLDRLEFPRDVPNSAHFKRFLKKRLTREARRATWGAGRENVIEYRFSVTELHIESTDGVIRVRCTAVGELPGGQAAKSHLTFGGDPRKRNTLVEKVLSIVARGVMTRLSELERIRRGDLGRSRVKNPTSG